MVPKEIAIGFSPNGWSCYRVKSEEPVLLTLIYHPGLGSLGKLGPKAWNASVLKCLLEGGCTVGDSYFFRSPGYLKNSSLYINKGLIPQMGFAS